MAGVSKVYPPQKQVLKNIYLSFFYGAKIGVIGLNGSGKSSLLRIIAGLDKSINGEVVFSPGYTVGYLAQEPELDAQKTVLEVVEEGVAHVMGLLREYEEINEKFGLPEVYENADEMDRLLARQGEIQDKIDASGAWEIDSQLERAMDALRCPDPDRKVATLSGGERRRVALCRLLLQEPDVLLLDEPTTFLDLKHQIAIYDLIRKLARQGLLVIAVTHDLALASAYSDRVLILSNGMIAADGYPAQALSPENIEQIFEVSPETMRRIYGR